MASKEIENAIDDFAETSHVRGKYPLSYRAQVIKDQRHYDTLWRRCVRDMERDKEQERAIDCLKEQKMAWLCIEDNNTCKQEVCWDEIVETYTMDQIYELFCE